MFGNEKLNVMKSTMKKKKKSFSDEDMQSVLQDPCNCHTPNHCTSGPMYMYDSY